MSARNSNREKLGTVYLVGAGPGDPELITVKGLRCLETADVVVHDRLVDRRLLARARREAHLVDVGKEKGVPASQRDISELLVATAMEGKTVVRLKGGDPFVFGRGGEEAEALAEAGVPFEVVPGVTSAVAAPAYAGIPLTHRDFASVATLVTGSESAERGGAAVQWEALAALDGTLVVLMGLEALGSIASRLLRAGRSGETPVALVEWGTEPYQRTVVGTLHDIEERAGAAGLAPPVVVVVGEVVKLREKVRWFDNRRLFGKRVLVTRSLSQSAELSDLLAREGALPLEIPMVEIRPVEDPAELDAALADLARYDWIVLASTNAVEAVFARLGELGKDSRGLHGVGVAAIGSATAEALRLRGIDADFVPKEFVSESVVDGLRPMGTAGASVLLPRSDIGREALAQGLTQQGATVHEVAAYRTVIPEDSGARLAQCLEQGVDVATFTSTSTFRNLGKLLDGDFGRLGGATVACIGPVTAAAVADAGLTADVVAGEHTAPGLLAALVAYYREGGRDE